jgi:signal transduction histidine kinase
VSDLPKEHNHSTPTNTGSDSGVSLPSIFSSTPRHYWLAQLIGWGSFASFMVFSSSSGSRESVIGFTLAKLFCALTGFALSHFWRLFLKKKAWFDRKEAFPIGRVFTGLLLLSVVQFLILVFADYVFRQGALFRDETNKFILIVMLIFMWFIVFLIWTLCYAVAQSQRRFVRFEMERLQLQVSVKEAELRALQAQINPHFFFNSLNTIRALVFQDPNTAAHAIGQLAGMMRHSLNSGLSNTVRLADEIKAVESYLSMEKLRFEERMVITMNVDKGLEEFALPPMILQTLVENAVKHGVELSMGTCEIQLSAERSGSGILILVKNQGKLSNTSNSTQLGFQNARRRLALLFGELAKCELREENGWVIATLILPGLMEQSI